MRKLLLFILLFLGFGRINATQDTAEIINEKMYGFIADSLNEMVFLGSNPDYRCQFYEVRKWEKEKTDKRKTKNKTS